MKIYGLDFTSAPRQKKPITCAQCWLDGNTLVLESFEAYDSFPDFERFLARPGPWIGGLDFPFGQPRKLIENLEWPRTWAGYVRLVAEMSKAEFDIMLKKYRDSRLPGDKQHLRRTDELAVSKSPMMMYGVPVGKMFFEGAPRLLASGASILPCHPREDPRILMEAYPGLAARRWVGRRSYKSDAKSRQTPERLAARREIVEGLRSMEVWEYYGFAIQIEDWVEDFIGDGSGDRLDALLCAVQAGWAYTQRESNYGIPGDCDLLEGWIVDPTLL